MKKETMERKLAKVKRWVEDAVEKSETRHIPRESVRVIMEDQMGWIDPRTQDKWIRILVRRKLLLPLNLEERMFYVPREIAEEQPALQSFDVPEVKLEKKE